MRRKGIPCKKRYPLRLWLGLGLLGILAAWCAFSLYVNTEIKPTLHELAEYEARAATVAAMNEAVAAEMQEEPALYGSLYKTGGGVVELDTVAANLARVRLIAAVEAAMQALPEHSWVIPFGSLTDNTLLGGLGPGWQVGLRPQGYVEGRIEEEVTALAINNTRCTAALVLQVTVNMILDGRTATLVVTNRVPLASVVVSGDTPRYYSD